jgi:tetratricopeptide (TPR) repeat protein
LVGWELAEGGRHGEALTEYRAAVDNFPRARYYLASELEVAGNLAEAVEQFNMFVQQQPDLLEVIPAHLKIGRIQGQQGNWRGAVQEFQQVLTMTPSSMDAQLSLADALSHLRRFDDAFPHYRAYLAWRPRDITALTDFGVALSQSEGHDKDAVNAFRLAVDLDPQSATLRTNLARALFLADDLPDARVQAEASLALNPNDSATHVLLGHALAAQGSTDEALRQFESAFRLDPMNAEARAALDTILGSARHHAAVRDR